METNNTPSLITTAVIMVAGYGTRRLPITKAIEKAMLPIGNRPLIDYIVADIARAGLRRIIFIVGEQSDQLRTYYGENPKLEAYLAQNGKTEQLDQIRTTRYGLQFDYVVQPADGRYGTAAALDAAKELVRSEPGFMLLSGDDFSWQPEATDLATLVEAWQPGRHAMLSSTVADEEVSRFGILDTVDGKLVRILEKPSPSQTASRQTNISKFLFDHSILAHLDAYMQGTYDHEYFLTDVLQSAVEAGESVHVLPISGTYLDGGSVESWLHANNFILKHNS
jgi:UTP--glucose-1-phosphate uridylyltransferase